jgi:hypothetical protein
MKNYYRILGVLDDAEDVVIRAAYKALAQRYHPDKWKGPSDEANKKMADINEAYSVLSDSLKRKVYDENFFKQNARNDAENVKDEDASDDLDDEFQGWKMATEFFPRLSLEFNELRKISSVLANTFKMFLLETKDFKNSRKIAQKLQDEYLAKYYSEDKYVQNFARLLLREGFGVAAIEVNKVLRFMGDSVTLAMIKQRVYEKFPETKSIESPSSNVDLRSIFAKARIRSINETEAIAIIEHVLCVRVDVRAGVLNNSYQMYLKDRVITFLSESELTEYAIKLVFENQL